MLGQAAFSLEDLHVWDLQDVDVSLDDLLVLANEPASTNQDEWDPDPDVPPLAPQRGESDLGTLPPSFAGESSLLCGPRVGRAESTSTSASTVSNSSDLGENGAPQERVHMKKTAWTHAEDRIILEGVRALGHKWSRIADMLPNERSDDAVRNRWHRLQRKAGARKAPAPMPWMMPSSSSALEPDSDAERSRSQGKHGDMWTDEEDRIIDLGVRVQGLRWKAIAELLPGRTDSGCRNRWVRTQERLFAEAGTPVQGAAQVFAALRKAGKMGAATCNAKEDEESPFAGCST